MCPLTSVLYIMQRSQRGRGPLAAAALPGGGAGPKRSGFTQQQRQQQAEKDSRQMR